MPQDIGENTIRTAQIARVPESVAERLGRHRLATGDIVFSRRGDVTRRALVRENNVDWLCGTGCLRVRPGSAVDSQFLSYLLGTTDARDWLLGNAVVTNMLNLNTTILGRLPLAVPPLSEQRAIAEVLGALDDKIAVNTAIAERAEDLAALTYDSIVASWPRVAISSVLDPILGGTPTRAREEYWASGDQLWISARDITSAPSRVVYDTAEKITTTAIAGTKAKALPAGSVILTARGTVGEVGRLARSASFNQSCYGFRPDTIPPGLLYFAILRATGRAKAVAHGSVFDTITKTTFDHLDLAWDANRAAAAEGAIAPLLDVVSATIVENRNLAATRDALLPQLMSGKLRVHDAEEAASRAGA